MVTMAVSYQSPCVPIVKLSGSESLLEVVLLNMYRL
jgi:hypothetical protein